MEACSGAHHWARRCIDYGLQPRIMAAQFVMPLRKGRATKNDRNDAEAIATAARQGNMSFVPVKSVEQQARPSWHRVREGYKGECLAIGSRARGLLAEFQQWPESSGQKRLAPGVDGKSLAEFLDSVIVALLLWFENPHGDE